MRNEEELESDVFIYDEEDLQKDNIIKFLFDNQKLNDNAMN